jgi:hypothetical protein
MSSESANLDMFGNPIGTEYREDICPPDLMCIPRETWDTLLEENQLAWDSVNNTVEPKGDAQAVADFTWQVLFLSPWELAYIALPMGVLAFYGLSIYALFKYIQKRFN